MTIEISRCGGWKGRRRRHSRASSLLISIIHLLISTNHLLISINHLLISIKMNAKPIFIDINKSAANVLNGKTGCSL